MNTKLTNLKTELREFIELSKTITPGKWDDVDGEGDFFGDTLIGLSETYENWREDVQFIARSRNISPAMAEALLVAVEGLEVYGNLSGSIVLVGGDARNSLQQILNIWEAAK